jgi:glycine reductase
MKSHKEKNLRVVHYINQFFARIGGEEQALTGLSEKPGPIGPGSQLERMLEGRGTVVATLYCGDDYFVKNQEETIRQVLKLVAGNAADLFIAGPAFNAGRYGQACGALCEAVQRELSIPAITGMYAENPAVELFRKDTYIVKTPGRAGKMPELFQKMLDLGRRIASGEHIGPAADEDYFPKGRRKNFPVAKTGAERAVDMILNKLQVRPFLTEIEPPVFDRVPPALPVQDIPRATIALVTDGGIVPVGNPDRIRGCAPDNPLGKYPIKGLEELTPETFECVHRGIDHRPGSADPNRFVPLDVMRELEQEGGIGHLYEWVNATSGCNLDYASAIRIGKEVAKDLLDNSVTGAILTSA